MATLAVVILTKNEEKHIEACIKSASFADDILVVDSGSTDRTEELAKNAGARFVSHPFGEDGFAGQRNFALTQIETDWIFYLDADERITTEGKVAIQDIVNGKQVRGAYRIKRLNIVMGKMMFYGGHKPDYSDRLFSRDHVHWEGFVHEVAKTDLPLETMSGNLHHYTYNSWEQYFQKFTKYTTMAAESYYQSGKRISPIGAISHSCFAFVRMYLLKQGFRDGYLGLVMSIMAAFYDLVKYQKLLKIQIDARREIDNGCS